jgi:hypothetical protein
MQPRVICLCEASQPFQACAHRTPAKWSEHSRAACIRRLESAGALASRSSSRCSRSRCLRKSPGVAYA